MLLPESSLFQWVGACHRCSVEHGWWGTPDHFHIHTISINSIARLTLPEKIALIQSEFDEAFEAWTEAGESPFFFRENDPKPEGWGIELIDALIRIFDLAGALNINLALLLHQRMANKLTKTPLTDDSLPTFAECAFAVLFNEHRFESFSRMQSRGFDVLPLARCRLQVSNVLEAYRKSYDEGSIPWALCEATLYLLGYLYATLPQSDIMTLLIAKYEYNKSRDFRHGGLRA